MLVSQDGQREKLEKAKITLNDCLACSGCITSAESVLITQQSHEELYRVLRQNKVRVTLIRLYSKWMLHIQHVCVCEQQVSSSEQKVVVVSVSPQSRASLAAHYGLSSSEVARRLTGFLKNLGEIESMFHMTSQRHPPVCIEVKETAYWSFRCLSRVWHQLQSLIQPVRKPEGVSRAIPAEGSRQEGSTDAGFCLSR